MKRIATMALMLTLGVRKADFSAMWNVHTTGISKHYGVFEN
jgi:hypothetical protein